MYRRPKFLEVLLSIRREMALEADYDVDLFAELTRTGNYPPKNTKSNTSIQVDPGVEAEPETIQLTTSGGA